MSDPVIAQRAPNPVEVVEGKKYFWCSCGKSARQPFFATDLTKEQIFYRKPIPHPRPELCISVDATHTKAHRCVMARTTRCSLTLRG